jgi:hypothetical protein
MKLFFFFLIFFFPLVLSAQIMTDDFSDGDFTHNPTWVGDTSLFIVNSTKQLQLHDHVTGKAYLSTASPSFLLRNNEWRFYIRLAFSPSGNNYGRVYLASDRSNLSDSVNGYFLQFGEAGNNDAVELFRQNGLSKTSVCRGENGQIAKAFNIRVKVTRDSLARWSVFVDSTAGTNFALEASGTDSTVSSTVSLGVYATYTSSNATKFYWDDFYCGPPGGTPPPPVFYRAKMHDVQIDEIMFKPNPPVNLPNYEYIELYNRTSAPIDLTNWSLSVGKRRHSFSPVTILPDSFLVVTSVAAVNAFGPGLPLYGLTGFSALNNTEAELCLRNDSDQVISYIHYTDKWYNDASKQNGGWSIEQIDPANPCGEQNNWKASLNQDGGTPGYRNSVYGANPDKLPPQLSRATALAGDSLRLDFTEIIDSLSMMDSTIYSITPFIPVTAIIPSGPAYKSLVLATGKPFQPELIYTITIPSGIKDCAGNLIGAPRTAQFCLPEPAQSHDILFNEILSDPKTGGVKYVELYNHSPRAIDLSQLNISNQDSVTGSLTDTKTISLDAYTLLPGEYVLLSTNGTEVKNQYYSPNPNGFLDVPALPKMDIGSGNLALSDLNGQIIDYMIYSSSMQFPLLSSTKGVSLERISFTRPSLDPDNWHSAAEAVGFGTPGYKNSEYLNSGNGSEVTLTNELFSPDDDGYQDELNIHYHFDAPDFAGTVTIFDSRGRLIRSLVQNQLLGAEGDFSWDGITNSREKAPIGIYIVYFEVFNEKGTVKHYKCSCVLASRL